MTQTAQPNPELISLLEASSEPWVVFDREYRVLATNQAYREFTGTGAGATGKRCYEISHHYSVPCDQAGETCPMMRSLASGTRERVLHLHHTPRGEEHVDIELIPLRDASGEITCFAEKMIALNRADTLAADQEMVGRAPAFQQMLALVARVARSDAVVLLEGESGTGKELVANTLHRASRRASRPFIAIDCSGIPDTLFESELFGHERGAFTGAVSRKQGLVEAASGGTLFLDEIGEIPPAMQVKLLRLLETGTYRRLGSAEIRRADARIVAATHRSLAAMVEGGQFRADLFYRLNVFPIRVPALRERRSDIPLLVESLLARVAPGRRLMVSAPALEHLLTLPYRGNVRELRNILERASLICDGDVIETAQLPELAASTQCSSMHEHEPAMWIDDARLAEALRLHRGSRRELAQKLGLSERTLYRRLQALKHATPG